MFNIVSERIAKFNVADEFDGMRRNISFIIILMICTCGFGATYQFNNWGTDDLWTTYNNWFGTVTSTDAAYIADTVRPERNGLYCLVDNTVTAKCSLLGIGSWNHPAELDNIPTLKITGGSLTITNDFYMGYEGHYHGNMTMSGGIVNVGRDWYIGRGYNGNATISGGVINIARGLQIGNINYTGKGYLNIYRGTVNVGNWWLAINDNSTSGESLGLIDITNGTLTIADSETGGTAVGRINDYVTAGKIVAFRGEGEVVVDHDSVNAKTIITATSPIVPGERLLFITPEKIEEIKSLVANQTQPYKSFYDKLIADERWIGAPPQYQSPTAPNDEMIYQRSNGDYISYLAFCYLMTNDDYYFNRCLEYVNASLSYPTWGQYPGTLGRGHQIFGLALAYNWLYEKFDQTTRNSIRDRLILETERLKTVIDGSKSYWSNKTYIYTKAVLAAGFSLQGQTYEADDWIDIAMSELGDIIDFLGNSDDGASPEGIGYAYYGFGSLMQAMELSKTLLDVDYFGNNFVNNFPYYSLYLSIPMDYTHRGYWATNIADNSVNYGFGQEDACLYLIANRTNNARAQWLAGKIAQMQPNGWNYNWGNLAWYKDIDSQGPLDLQQPLPNTRYFSNLELYSMRSDWSGKETTVQFKCGPSGGDYAHGVCNVDPGVWHAHPDAGHFTLFAGGKSIFRDDGYYSKFTSQHNTLVFIENGNAIGQKGEGASGLTWYKDSKPYIKKYDDSDSKRFIYVMGDVRGSGQNSYIEEALQKFNRHLIFVQPNLLLVIDDIDLSSQKDMDIRFFPEFDESNITLAGNTCLLNDGNVKVRMQLVGHSGGGSPYLQLQQQNYIGIDGGLSEPVPVINVRNSATNWKNAVAISWSDTAALPETIGCEIDGDSWVFTKGHQIITLNLADETVNISGDSRTFEQVDLNSDGIINALDLGIFASQWLMTK